MRLSPTLTAAVGALSLLATTLLPVATAGSAAATPSLVAQDPDSVLTVAHRGARYVAPENTLVALKAAIDRGVDFVEVDVQRSKDGRLVLIHDNDLARTTNIEKVFPKRKSWAVGDVTYGDMKKLDAGSWKAERYAGTRIPSLKQALRLVQRTGTGIMIELKSPKLYPGIESEVSVALRQVDGYLGRAIRTDQLVVQSFDFDSARAFKELEPRVKLALLGTPDPSQLPDLSRWADEISSRHKTVDAEYVAAVHALGMDSSVWTVDTEENMNANLDKGVDAVVTNRPNILGRVLQQRGAETS
ncbi:glycerophosphodiester phosphodiesterase [Nocardioides iriomotensis]|uniref:Glycerophosphodiester phosphodiesterase n=1 Tax=Nocardioides iriomotensis TaxID=715784 RepID=A0A4Q5IUY8_9ACTN|nr:glycerophosphodiester phosphodiesterase family protein [Nocardioides iriomotensis]RYU09724.1 glycerophosphodiester phosphodiesterase [Nocardioides iriomotensis]